MAAEYRRNLHPATIQACNKNICRYRDVGGHGGGYTSGMQCMIKARESSGRSLVPWLIALAALAVAAGFLVAARMSEPLSLPYPDAVTLYPAARDLPAFHLTRADGRSLTNADWQGRWTIAFFGYTNCPDVCPMTLAAFSKVRDQLGQSGVANRIRFDFISVDPARDTPEQLARYVSFYSDDFVAATGTDAELRAVTAALGLVYEHVSNTDGTIDVDHSASAVLIDPQGRQAGLVRPPFDPEQIAADLVVLARSSR